MIITDKQKMAIILEYEEILVEKRRQASTYYFGDNADRNNSIAVEIFRYLIENILGWDSETAEQRLDLEILKNYKVDKYLSYINFYNEPNGKARFYTSEENGEAHKKMVKSDIQVLLKYVFGPRYHLDEREMIIVTYNDLLNGVIKKFPKHFFDVINDGKLKVAICLQHAITQQQNFENIEDVYRLFGDRNILKWLDKWKLRDIAEQFYDSPIDFLHDALPETEKDEVFYNYYKRQYEEFISESGRKF
ncbi:hypothetical protein [Ruminococcus albus]|uniref:hypothetical protein n=1 Tax=Ruminococcus albus TaxID=1264 RepID=UPI0004654FA3|nr:hypothetical protein [Ruminococcus albus]